VLHDASQQHRSQEDDGRKMTEGRIHVKEGRKQVKEGRRQVKD
jgi:hypothetical protein